MRRPVNRLRLTHAKQRGGFDDEKRTQPLAAAKRRVTHGIEQPFRPREFGAERLAGKQRNERALAHFGNMTEALLELARGLRLGVCVG